jgi:hypothetical protein
VVGLGLNANNITQVNADGFFAGTLAVTEARMQTMTARRHAGRTLVEWTTGREVSNLGFRVWRQDGGRRMLITPSPLAGSALLTASTLTAGNRYRWLDPGATPRASYWIESIALDGRREWNGPVVPVSAPFSPNEARVPLLRDLGQSVAPAVSTTSRLSVAGNDLRRAAAPPDLLPKQQELAAAPTVKISVAADGWYRVTREELLAAGLDPATDPRRLHLYADGREVAIAVEGEAENRIDAIRFYGTALDTPATATRVYWLAVEDTPGRRMAKSATSSTNAGGGATPGSSFLVTAERRDKSVFYTALPNGENESFFGPVVTGDAVSQALRLAHIDRTATMAQVEIGLQGVSDASESGSAMTPGHIVAVTLNGQLLEEVRFTGREAATLRHDVPVSLLVEGENTVSFTAKNGDSDVSLVSYVRITYAHTYELDGSTLVLTAGGGSSVAVRGAAAPMFALDVTAPSVPVEVPVTIDPVTVDPVTIDNGVAHLTSPGGVKRTIVVTSQFAKAARVEANVPSALHAAAGADMIIIVHPSLRAAIEPLRQLRSAQGLSVLVASVDDIYDEYGYGAKDPSALRSFLAATRSWATPPRYVLLAGDATFDPRNYLDLGDFDLVPTKLLVTDGMKTASDSWLADFNDDGAADVALGRLPARTPEELQIEVGKIVAYENAPAASWTKSALLVSDDDAAIGFGDMSAAVRELLPAGTSITSIAVTAGSVTAARNDLLARLDAGALLVNFVGHGSVGVWTSGGLFSGDDAAALTNGERLPFVVAMTCLNGYFHDVYTTSLAEELLAAPKGGAVGVFASTALTDAKSQSVANQELIHALFAGQATLGEAAIAAQQRAIDPSVRRTFLLFGDPAMRLKQ